MGVITISREYGSNGRNVGQNVAKAMRYLYMDREIITHVATEAGVPVSEVENFDERPEHPVMRALRKFLAQTHPCAGMSGVEWAGSLLPPVAINQSDPYPSILDEDAYVRLTQKIMLRLADQGNVVLLGRGSQALLADRPDAIHVRIVAPLEYRIQTAMQQDNLNRDQAIALIQRNDAQRKRYIKRHYGVDWANPKYYHLTVNTGQVSLEAATRAIVEAAHHLPLNRVHAAEAALVGARP